MLELVSHANLTLCCGKNKSGSPFGLCVSVPQLWEFGSNSISFTHPVSVQLQPAQCRLP